MEDKRWGILEEVEKLTEENAAYFLSRSLYGQAKIKGKFIRDEQGRLVPVLVRTVEKRTLSPTGRCILPGREASRPSSFFNGLKKLLCTVFKG